MHVGFKQLHFVAFPHLPASCVTHVFLVNQEKGTLNNTRNHVTYPEVCPCCLVTFWVAPEVVFLSIKPPHPSLRRSFFPSVRRDHCVGFHCCPCLLAATDHRMLAELHVSVCLLPSTVFTAIGITHHARGNLRPPMFGPAP